MNNASETEKTTGGSVRRRNRGVSKRTLMVITAVFAAIAVGVAAWYVWQRKAKDDASESVPRITYSQEAKNELEEYQDDNAPGTEDPIKRSQFYLDRFYIKFDAEDYTGAAQDFSEAEKYPQFEPGYAAYLVLSDVYMKLKDSGKRDAALAKAERIARQIENEEQKNDALSDIESRRKGE